MAIRLDPKDGMAFLYRAQAYAEIDKPDKAIENFDAAVRCMPRKPEPFVLRGAAYMRINQFERAIQDYNEAIRMSRNS